MVVAGVAAVAEGAAEVEGMVAVAAMATVEAVAAGEAAGTVVMVAVTAEAVAAAITAAAPEAPCRRTQYLRDRFYACPFWHLDLPFGAEIFIFCLVWL